MAHQWGRFIWWLGQNAAVAQIFLAFAAVLLTAVLAYFNRRYISLTSELARSAGEQSASAEQQLRLLAHPNPIVEVTVDPKQRTVSVEIINRGAYPFRLDNAEVKENIGTDEDEEKPWTAKLHELCGVIVGSNGGARTREFLHNERIELGSGAFENCVTVEFDCEDAIGLVKKRYSYCNVKGLREF